MPERLLFHRPAGKPHLEPLRVIHDDRERLLQFVCEHAGNQPHGPNLFERPDLFRLLLEFEFRPQPVFFRFHEGNRAFPRHSGNDGRIEDQDHEQNRGPEHVLPVFAERPPDPAWLRLKIHERKEIPHRFPVTRDSPVEPGAAGRRQVEERLQHTSGIR